MRVPFLLGAALVFALLVDARRGHGAIGSDDLRDSLTTHVDQQSEAIRRYNAAMADGAANTARAAMEEIVLHNRQMVQKLGGCSRPQGAQQRPDTGEVFEVSTCPGFKRAQDRLLASSDPRPQDPPTPHRGVPDSRCRVATLRGAISGLQRAGVPSGISTLKPVPKRGRAPDSRC